MLQKKCENILSGVVRHLNCKLSVFAFGSLGRSEFVFEYSDLDPLIIVEPLGGRPPSSEDVRAAVLQPLMQNNFWLTLDDGDLVREFEWADIQAADLKYPVYLAKQFVEEKGIRAEQRRWQGILESRPLYSRQLSDDLRGKIAPHLSRRLASVEREESQRHIDFFDLATRAPQFFAGFEDPQFLYKDAFKYWKDLLPS